MQHRAAAADTPPASQAMAHRGPTGSAPPPPAWLTDAPLPLHVLPAGTPLFRIHPGHLHPIFYSPGPGAPPRHRFDSPGGHCGVLYAAQSMAGAFVETVLRNPHTRLIGLREITARALSMLHATRPLRLVAMYGSGLQQLGTDNAISTGPYTASGAWTDALLAHPARPDGILYASRHDPDELCIALFSGTESDLVIAEGPTPLADMLRPLAAFLHRYGKGVSPD